MCIQLDRTSSHSLLQMETFGCTVLTWLFYFFVSFGTNEARMCFHFIKTSRTFVLILKAVYRLINISFSRIKIVGVFNDNILLTFSATTTKPTVQSTHGQNRVTTLSAFNTAHDIKSQSQQSWVHIAICTKEVATVYT